MYLKELQGRDPPDSAGRFQASIRAGRKAGAPIPQIWHLFAANPAAAKHLCSYVQEVMRGPGEHAPGFRELIAAFTSARNHCLF
jgi:hypothetical protein